MLIFRCRALVCICAPLLFLNTSFAKIGSFNFNPPPDSSSCQITASPADTILCNFPQTIQLNASYPLPADSVVWQWSPSTGLNSTTIPNPLATVTGPITYTIQATGKLGANRVVNGNFESGNTGFITSYNLDCSPPSGSLATGEYCVTSNPHNVNANAAFCSDHTTETGLMLIANGSTTASSKVWEETIQISPDSMYNFGFWAASWSTTKLNLAHFDVIINGVDQGKNFIVSPTDCNWQMFSLIYTPNGSATADIQIIDLSSAANGNDFALDDISLRAFCQTAASVTIKTITLQVNPSDATLCPNDSVQLTASIVPDSSVNVNYQWSPSAGLSCTNCPDPIAKPTQTTEYTVTATIVGGCSFIDSVKVIVLDSCPVVLACSLAAGPDTSICDFLATVQLHANYSGTADTVFYQWMPAIGLNNPNLQNPIATVTKPIIYIAQAQAIYGVNLVANGDFELGNTDFTTSYNQDCNPSGGMISENEYCVTNNPHNVYSSSSNCADRTSGSGLMFVGKGDTVSNSNVWEQTVSIAPNTTYAFSFWGMNWLNSATSLTNFDVIINGVDQQKSFQVNPPSCDWKRFIVIWNSDTNKTADIKIINLSNALQGNDFAIDDIKLQLVCTAKDSLVISRCLADSCTYAQNYDSANTWINHGTGLFIFNDELNFLQAHGDADNRLTKQIIKLNNNAWTCDFNFTPQAIDPIAGGSAEVICFSSDSNYTWRTPPLGSYSNNSFIEVDYESAPHYGTSKTYNFFANTKFENDSPLVANDNIIPANAIQIPPAAFNVEYYCRLQRLSPILGLLSVFYDSLRTKPYPGSPTCFSIPAGIQNLNWLQHCTLAQAGADRTFTGRVDSVEINNCVDPLSFVAFADGGASACEGSKVQLHAGVFPDSSGVKYQWNADTTLSCTNCPDPFATPKHNSIYIVTATLPGGCTLTDSVVVKIDSIAAFVSSSGKIAYCSTDTFQLHARTLPDTLTGITYQWSPSTGLSCTDCPNPVATSDSSRTYSVKITSRNGCSAMDSIRVNVLPISLSLQNENICLGDSIQLFSNLIPDTLSTVTFQWSPPTNLSCTTCPNPFAKPDSTTKYYVIAQTPSGCIIKDSATVKVRTADTISISVAPSAVVEEGDSVQLTASGGFNYTWIPPLGLSCTNCPNPIAKPDTTTTYYVTSSEGNCKGADSVKITIIPICEEIALPSAFTPNGDGHNDIFKLLYKGDAQLKYFRIYNRWGQEVFNSNDLNIGWDGTYNGKQEPVGTYVWVLDAICHNREVFEKGNVTLIR
jgi:gliding motility-associated-like protein